MVGARQVAERIWLVSLQESTQEGTAFPPGFGTTLPLLKISL